MTGDTQPQSGTRVTLSDEDSSIQIERVDDDAIAIWAHDDTHPDVTLAYTFVSEEAFRKAIEALGYQITPTTHSTETS